MISEKGPGVHRGRAFLGEGFQKKTKEDKTQGRASGVAGRIFKEEASGSSNNLGSQVLRGARDGAVDAAKGEVKSVVKQNAENVVRRTFGLEEKEVEGVERGAVIRGAVSGGAAALKKEALSSERNRLEETFEGAWEEVQGRIIENSGDVVSTFRQVLREENRMQTKEICERVSSLSAAQEQFVEIARTITTSDHSPIERVTIPLNNAIYVSSEALGSAFTGTKNRIKIASRGTGEVLYMTKEAAIDLVNILIIIGKEAKISKGDLLKLSIALIAFTELGNHGGEYIAGHQGSAAGAVIGMTLALLIALDRIEKRLG